MSDFFSPFEFLWVLFGNWTTLSRRRLCRAKTDIKGDVRSSCTGQICIVKISASCPMEQSFYMFRVYRLLFIHFEQCKLILSPQCIFFIDKVFKPPFPPTWTNKEREQIAAIKPPPPQKKISSFNFIIIYIY